MKQPNFVSAQGNATHFEEQFNTASFLESTPNFVSIKNARVLATADGRACGVVDRSGSARPLSLLRWGNQLVFGGPQALEQASSDFDPPSLLPGRSLYIGHTRPHFGHFLLEGLSRLWPLLEAHKYDHFVVVDPFATGEIPDYQREIYSLFFNTEKLRIVNSSWIECEELDLPEASWVYGRKVHQAMRGVFERIRSSFVPDNVSPKTGSLVYLSRSTFKPKKPGATLLLGEHTIEQKIRESGGDIVHLEDHNFADQVRLINSYENIVSYGGSGAHLLLFGNASQNAYLYNCRGFKDFYLQAKLMNDQAYHFIGLRLLNDPHWLRLESDYKLNSCLAHSYRFLQEHLISCGLLSGDIIQQDLTALRAEYLETYLSNLGTFYANGDWKVEMDDAKRLRVFLDDLITQSQTNSE